jgi:hypothetical protein
MSHPYCSASTAGAEESCPRARPRQGQPGLQGTTSLRSAIRRPEPSTPLPDQTSNRFATLADMDEAHTAKLARAEDDRRAARLSSFVVLQACVRRAADEHLPRRRRRPSPSWFTASRTSCSLSSSDAMPGCTSTPFVQRWHCGARGRAREQHSAAQYATPSACGCTSAPAASPRTASSQESIGLRWASSRGDSTA